MAEKGWFPANSRQPGREEVRHFMKRLFFTIGHKPALLKVGLLVNLPEEHDGGHLGGEGAEKSICSRLRSVRCTILRRPRHGLANLAEGAPNAGNVLANMNVLTSGQAVDHLNADSQARLRELHSLLREPAIARVVTEDEEGVRRVYFVSRATPHRSPTDGSLAVSYNATPLGRLGHAPVGNKLQARTRDGERSLRVLERALLHPSEESSR